MFVPATAITLAEFYGSPSPSGGKGWKSSTRYFDMLPAELVAEILFWVTYVVPTVWPTGTEHRRYIISLLLTCSRFKKIVLSTPTIWSRVTITFNSKHKRALDKQLILAKAAPLDVALDFKALPGSMFQTLENAKIFQKIVNRHTGSTPQWRSLEAELPIVPEQRVNDYIAIFHQTCPRLRTVKLSATHKQYLPWILPDGSKFSNIRELKIHDIIPNWKMVSGFHQLEDLNISNALARRVTPQDTLHFVECISSCQKLRNLFIQNIGGADPSWLSDDIDCPDPVTMPCLSNILLTQSANARVTSYILALINAPEIQRVIVGEWVQKTRTLTVAAGPLITSKSPSWTLPLARLAVRSTFSCFDDADHTIMSSRGLRHLRLDASPLQRIMENPPACFNGPTLICRKLESLTTRHLSLKAIRKIVHDRMGTLKEVNIAFEDMGWMSSQSGVVQSLSEYESKEWDLAWLWAHVPLVRLYGVEPDKVVVHIAGIDEETMLRKAQALAPLCDFKWIPWA